jgi:pimeloyl-ACP methyl ester carboxylesterase
MPDASVTIRVEPSGRRVSVREYGHVAGWPVIYCHGMPGSGVDAMLADGAARDLGIRLIAPDRSGYGDSDYAERTTFAALAADIVGTADALGLARFALIGFSGAGAIALACAAQYPERISRVALSGSMAPIGDVAVMHGMSETNRALFSMAQGSREEFERAFGAAFATGESIAGALLATLPDVDRRSFEVPSVRGVLAATCATALKQGARAIFDDFQLLARPWRFDLRQVTCPVFLWHGTADGNVPPAMSEALARELQRATVRLVPGAGHFLLWTNWADILGSAIADPLPRAG